MVYSYGARVDDNSNAITVIDEENETAVTTGYVNGEYVEFSGGGSSDLSTATVTVNLTPPEGVEIDATRLFTNFPFPTDDFEEGGYQDIVSWYDVDGKIPMIINKGKGFIDGIGSRDGNYMVKLSEATISGNASYSDNKIVVTGDCTITGNWVLNVQP